MRPFTTLFLVALCALQSLGQSKIESKPFDAIKAKSVKVLKLPDSVAVILEDREAGTQSGAYLQVTSIAKWATPLLDGVNINRTELPGEWVLFAKPGKYRILLAEFDPETGPSYSYHDLVIGQPSEDDDEDPPTGDLSALKKVVKESAAKLNDLKSQQALVAAYKVVIQSPLTDYDTLVDLAKKSRASALQLRVGESRSKDWSVWLAAVDTELLKVVKPGDSAAYRNALKAIVEALQ